MRPLTDLRDSIEWPFQEYVLAGRKLDSRERERLPAKRKLPPSFPLRLDLQALALRRAERNVERSRPFDPAALPNTEPTPLRGPRIAAQHLRKGVDQIRQQFAKSRLVAVRASSPLAGRPPLERLELGVRVHHLPRPRRNLRPTRPFLPRAHGWVKDPRVLLKADRKERTEKPVPAWETRHYPLGRTDVR